MYSFCIYRNSRVCLPGGPELSSRGELMLTVESSTKIKYIYFVTLLVKLIIFLNCMMLKIIYTYLSYQK